MKLLRKFYCRYILLSLCSLTHLTSIAQVNFDLPPHSPAGTLVSSEYFFDTDPGAGNGIQVPVSSGNFTADVSTLLPGVHTLSVRTKDSWGHYSLTNSSVFFKLPGSSGILPHPPLAAIIKAEYFFDHDPGIGNGTFFNLPPGTVTSGTYPIDVASLSPGVHTFFIRTTDTNGRQSLSGYSTFLKAPAGYAITAHPPKPSLLQAEYFFDNDPGMGNGIPFVFNPDSIISISSLGINLTGVSDSVHVLYIRTKDDNNRWSFTNSGTFALINNISLPSPAPLDSFTAFEYFFDNDPGFGNGTWVAVGATANLNNFPVAVNTSGLSDSQHVFFIRTLNKRSLTQAIPFQVGNPLPVSWLSFTAFRRGTDVQLHWKVKASAGCSYFDVERSHDGRHFEILGQVMAKSDNHESATYDFTDTEPLAGISYYRLKQVDLDDSYQYSPVIAIKSEDEASPLTISNPAHEVLYITGGNHLPEGTVYEIIHLSGKTVRQVTSDGNYRQTISLSGLSAGHYWIRYKHGNQAGIARFIKE